MKDLERKTHYKMYKSHRGWLVAGITVAGLMVGVGMGPGTEVTAQADITPPTTEVTATTTTDEPDPAEPTTATSTEPTADPAATPTVAATTTETPAPVINEAPSDEAPTTGTDISDEPAPDGSSVSEEPGTDSITEPQTPSSGAPAAIEATTTPDETAGAGDGAVANEEPVLPATTDPSTTDAKAQGVTATAEGLADADPVADEATTVTIGIGPIDPSLLTDPVTGKPIFNISKTGQLQYTYDHTDANGLNSDLWVVDGYDAAYQTQGSQTWLGQTYADGIDLNAKGEDVNSPLQYGDGSHPLYIDEWLPDSGLQYLLWQANFASKYATIADFRNNFTKAELGTVTSITTTEKMQSVNGNQVTPTSTYMALMSMRTLEGMQNATNLQTLYLSPDVIVSLNVFGNALKNGNLWDIRALSPLENLKSVNITLFSVTDISALGNKQFLTAANLSYNQITDISPLATDPLLDVSKQSLGYQHVLLKPITLNTSLGAGNTGSPAETLGYTTPSFIIKDLTAANLPIRGFNNDEGSLYPSLYPSSADTDNVNANTLTWYNLLNDTAAMYGSLSTTWSDPNSGFAGWILQPYALDEQAASMVVNVQLLQANGQQLTLGPSHVITGQVGDTINVQQDATVMTLLNQQLANGYQFSGLVLDGTGLYSDYLANNGKANAVTNWTTKLAAEAQNWTVLFFKDVQPWNVAVDYGYQDADGNFVAITDTTGAAVTATYNGTSDAELALNEYQQDFTDYVYLGARTTTDGQTWTLVGADALVPFLGAKQTIQMLYAQAKRATVTVIDATTGATLQTLDYTTNPELRGAIGTTSSFDSTTVIASQTGLGYVLVTDGTKNADGTSAIVFADTNAANTTYTITLAHGFETTVQNVTETVQYQDKGGTQVAPSVRQTVNFATVTDQVTQDVTRYVNQNQTAAPILDVTGTPTDATWTAYVAGATVTLAAIVNPGVTGMHVVATTDPANDLTQITAQGVTSASENLAYVVTYAHDFATVLNQVTETIQYVDQSGAQVAPPVSQTVTFATVTDLSNQQTTLYQTAGAQTDLALDEDGLPTDAIWTAYTAGETVMVGAIVNPTVSGMHVVATTDPANDLTQTTEQSLTNAGPNLVVTVTYAADSTPGGGGGTDPEIPDPTPEPEPEPEPGDGGNEVVPPTDIEKPSIDEGDDADQGTKAPDKKGNGGQSAGLTTNGGAAATGLSAKRGRGAAQTMMGQSGQANQVNLAAQSTTTQLPQTDERSGSGLAVLGLALLTTVLGWIGIKKQHE